MRIKSGYFLFIVLLLIVAGGYYAYHEYTRKPADLASVDAMEKADAASLVSLYETDEQKANKRYLGKPIDVTGTIAEITNQHDTLVNVMLGNPEGLHRVSCLLNVKHTDALKQFKTGDKITIRGICTGYLMDVELNRCVVIR